MVSSPTWLIYLTHRLSCHINLLSCHVILHSCNVIVLTDSHHSRSHRVRRKRDNAEQALAAISA